MTYGHGYYRPRMRNHYLGWDWLAYSGVPYYTISIIRQIHRYFGPHERLNRLHIVR